MRSPETRAILVEMTEAKSEVGASHWALLTKSSR